MLFMKISLVLAVMLLIVLTIALLIVTAALMNELKKHDRLE